MCVRGSVHVCACGGSVCGGSVCAGEVCVQGKCVHAWGKFACVHERMCVRVQCVCVHASACADANVQGSMLSRSVSRCSPGSTLGGVFPNILLDVQGVAESAMTEPLN